MINSDEFVKHLSKKFSLSIGVPDSLLKNLIFSLEKCYKKKHIVTTNEGSAVAFAIGHYLSTKTPAIVYLQNSGLGNAINPLTSLAHKNVYGIPMILLIGWRGEMIKKNQIKDEPQHNVQGKITLQQLKLLEIPFKILNPNERNLSKLVNDLNKLSFKKKSPVALVIKKNTFQKINYKNKNKNNKFLMRKEILNIILENISKNTVVVCTTGLASRELYQLRLEKKIDPSKDFLTVGGMGHASQIASGIAFSKKKKKIICIDGDGSLLMHLGSNIMNSNLNNFTHILINNGVHDSVGGQLINSTKLEYSKIAKIFNYKNTIRIFKKKDIIDNIKTLSKKNTSSFIEIMSKQGYDKSIGRPKEKLEYRKKIFMKNL